jgi:hypothetical protein
MRLILRLGLRCFDAVGTSHIFLRWGCPEVAQRAGRLLSAKRAEIYLYSHLISLVLLVATGGLEPPTPAL